jgi:hypothetical protein
MGLRRWYINITIKILDIIRRSDFYLKHNGSETGFCLRLHVEPILVGPETHMLYLLFPPE